MVYLLFLGLLAIPASSEHHRRKDSKIAYFKGILPAQIFKCLEKSTLLRCMKYFILLRIESREYDFPNSGNSTKGFLDQILKEEKNIPTEIPHRLSKLSDEELTDRLTIGLQRFFEKRPITLKFMPNMMVQLVPSGTNYLEMSLKKATVVKNSGQGRSQSDGKNEDLEISNLRIDEIDGEATKDGKAGGMKTRKEYYQLMQIGVPLLLLPGAFFAGFLPMLIPVLKFATIFTSVVNYGSLIAAIAYFARQHALEKEVQQTVYFNPGYKF
jgi:hypothetical protein